MEKCIWKQSPKSPSIGSFSFFPFLGREEGTFTENQCGVVDGTPHRLWSSVLAGRDNYTAVCNKVSKQTNIFYTTFSTEISARVSWERSTISLWCDASTFSFIWRAHKTKSNHTERWGTRLTCSAIRDASVQPAFLALVTYYTQTVLYSSVQMLRVLF